MIVWKKSPIDSAIILSAITAYLYAASSAHFGGYLGVLQLDPDVLERNFQQAIYQGSLKLFQPILLLFVGYSVIRYIYSHMLLPTIISALRKSWINKKRFIKFKRAWFGRRKDTDLELREKAHTIRSVQLVFVFLVFLFSIAYMRKSGEELGSSMLKKIECNTAEESEYVSVIIDSEEKNLIYLACGARSCAAADPESKRVYYFPQNGHSFLLR